MPSKPSRRYRRGWRELQVVDEHAAEGVLRDLKDIAPDLGRFIVEFAFGDVYARPGLTRRQRELITVAALSALGNARPQLKVHINAALNVGCRRREIVETCLQMAVYAGFPAALNAIYAAKEVFDERDGRGRQKESGPENG